MYQTVQLLTRISISPDFTRRTFKTSICPYIHRFIQIIMEIAYIRARPTCLLLILLSFIIFHKSIKESSSRLGRLLVVCSTYFYPYQLTFLSTWIAYEPQPHILMYVRSLMHTCCIKQFSPSPA